MRFFITFTILTLALCAGVFIPDFSNEFDTNTAEASNHWTFVAAQNMDKDKTSRLRRMLTVTPPDTLEDGDYWHVRMTSRNHVRGIRVYPGRDWAKREAVWWAGDAYVAEAKIYRGNSSSEEFVIVGAFRMPDCPEGTESNDRGRCDLIEPDPLPESNPDFDSRMRLESDVRAFVESPTCNGTHYATAAAVSHNGERYAKIAIFHAGEESGNDCHLDNYTLRKGKYSNGRDGLSFNH